MRTGISIARGGASRLVDALVALLREAGGELRSGADVARIEGRGGRAAGVVLAGGERLAARRAVVANVTPTQLYGRLLERPLPRCPAPYRYGPGTMMVHLALRGPIPWRAGEDLASFAYVHVAPYVDDLARTYAQAARGCCRTSRCWSSGRPRRSTRRARPRVSTSSGCRSVRCRRRSAATAPARSRSASGRPPPSPTPTACSPSSSATRPGSGRSSAPAPCSRPPSWSGATPTSSAATRWPAACT